MRRRTRHTLSSACCQQAQSDLERLRRAGGRTHLAARSAGRSEKRSLDPEHAVQGKKWWRRLFLGFDPPARRRVGNRHKSLRCGQECYMREKSARCVRSLLRSNHRLRALAASTVAIAGSILVVLVRAVGLVLGCIGVPVVIMDAGKRVACRAVMVSCLAFSDVAEAERLPKHQ